MYALYTHTYIQAVAADSAGLGYNVYIHYIHTYIQAVLVYIIYTIYTHIYRQLQCIYTLYTHIYTGSGCGLGRLRWHDFPALQICLGARR